MSDHALMVLFALANLVLLLWLLFALSERNHWRENYESLRNLMLKEGQAQTRRAIRALDEAELKVERVSDKWLDNW